MPRAATTWNFAAEGNNRLAELMKSFGCADVIASVDAEEFGRRAGELIRMAVKGRKALLRTEDAPRATKSAETERFSLLNVLQNAPRSDRLTMLASTAACASLLIAAGAAVLSQ